MSPTYLCFHSIHLVQFHCLYIWWKSKPVLSRIHKIFVAWTLMRRYGLCHLMLQVYWYLVGVPLRCKLLIFALLALVLSLRYAEIALLIVVRFIVINFHAFMIYRYTRWLLNFHWCFVENRWRYLQDTVTWNHTDHRTAFDMMFLWWMMKM